MRCEGINGCNSNISMSIMFIIEFDLIHSVSQFNSSPLCICSDLIPCYPTLIRHDDSIQFKSIQCHVTFPTENNCIESQFSDQSDRRMKLCIHACKLPYRYTRPRPCTDVCTCVYIHRYIFVTTDASTAQAKTMDAMNSFRIHACIDSLIPRNV